MGVAEDALWQVPSQALPARAIVARLVDVGRGVTLLMAIDRQVGDSLDVQGGLDIRDRAQRLDAAQSRGDVGPRLTIVPGHLHLTVVGAGPDDARLEPRLGDGEDRRRDGRPSVIEGQASGATHQVGIGSRQIGTDDLPGMPLIPGAMDVLAAVVDGVVIVRRDRQGRRPLNSILELRGGPAFDRLRPDADVAR